MRTSVLTRNRTPFDDVEPEALRDFADFVRMHAPRWLTGSRSLSRITVRRAHEKAVACDRRRGIRHVDAPERTGAASRSRRRRASPASPSAVA